MIDTSVVIKWFHSDGEGELESARALRTAHIAGQVDAYVLDLGMYELGNVLVRALRWSAKDVAHQLEDLLEILPTPLVMEQAWFTDAARLAVDHKLSFSDASWAACAHGLSIPLVTADRQLVAAGLAATASATAARLGLRA